MICPQEKQGQATGINSQQPAKGGKKIKISPTSLRVGKTFYVNRVLVILRMQLPLPPYCKEQAKFIYLGSYAVRP